MNLFKRKKKNDPKKGQKFLKSISSALKEGELNKDVSHIKEIINKSETVDINGLQDYAFKEKEKSIQFVELMHNLEQLHQKSDKKRLERLKKEKKFWYKTKAKMLGKWITFKDKMDEIWSFIKHEFLTVRKLVFLINDLFNGREYKNRKLLYTTKDIFIKHSGYKRGEVRFNQMVRNITKGAELNKRLIEGKY